MIPPALILAWTLLVPFALAQDQPLVLSFSVDSTYRYRIQLTVRTEVEGQQAVQIGAKTYVKPFSWVVEDGVGWVATRRVVSVSQDGAAEIEETLTDSLSFRASASPEGEETEKLVKALREALGRWRTDHTLHYRETRTGQLLGLPPEGVPPLAEEGPRLVSLWLLRALRPSAALPSMSLRFGDRWEEPRVAPLPNWAAVRGSETGEWLEARESPEPAARLHIVQQIFGQVVSGAEKPPEGSAQARFYAESLNAISLGDGRLLAATRSATREITWTLVPVEGLRERPQFRARLAVEVQIEPCHEDPCLSPDHLPVRKQQ